MALTRPRLYWQVAFNAHPNDRFAVPIWTDLSHMYKRVEGPYSSGSQYELAQAQASQPSIRWLDINEYLNPANTGSPYYPEVLPYRRLLGQAVYPPAGTGNLLNASSWRPNDAPVYDPSFESYANGAALPGWLTAVGGVSASITTTNPQQGTKSTTYTVAANTTPQGLSWEAACIPGQAYTASVYVRQASASTQRLLVGNQTLGYDRFSRTVSPGWGTSDFGGAYGIAGGGVIGDQSVSGGTGRHSVGSTAVHRYTTLGTGIIDFDQTVTITVPSVITGASTEFLRVGITGAFIDASNYYSGWLHFKPDGLITIQIGKRVAGAFTDLGTVNTSVAYAAGGRFKLRLQRQHTTLRAAVWQADRFAPAGWDVTATDSDTALAAGGAIAYYTFASSGITNPLPLVVQFDDTMIVGSTSSTTTTTTGAYVRLTHAFTASQPVHTMTVCTRGTAVAGAVNVDAIQHEIGSSATAFTTSGAIVAPIMDGYVERWTREYEDQGFTGYAVTPVVDALAVCNTIGLDTEYAIAVLKLAPNYLWRLDGQDGATVAPEINGARELLFEFTPSIFGPGTLPRFGTAMDIPGAAGATGVQFTPPNPADSIIGEYTLMSLGGVAPGISWPRSFNSTSWTLTAAVWAKVTPSSPVVDQTLFVSYVPIPLLGTISPLFIKINTLGHVVATTTSRINLVAAEGVTDVTDDVAHLIVVTVNQVNGGNTTVTVYVDGVLDGSASATTASMGGMATEPAKFLRIGSFGDVGYAEMTNGTIKYLGLWERGLSTTEITALWTAGGLGHAGELTGARLERRLRDNAYGGKLRISPGSSTMQPVSAFADGLTELHNVTNVEGGKSWSARDGALVFEGRQQRWLRVVPRGVFGEDTANGEIPYLEGVQFDFDPMFVFADVQVTRINGATAQGGTLDARILAARKYFPRSAPQDQGDYGTDGLAQYKADWIFHTHREPLLRVSVITLDPASNPALWPVVLNLENGQRWTVKRRAKAANAGAGFTISGDYFIEQITFNGLNMDNDNWTVTMFLSPAGLATASPGVTFQPWILGDSTYGVLGSTTVLGW